LRAEPSHAQSIFKINAFAICPIGCGTSAEEGATSTEEGATSTEEGATSTEEGACEEGAAKRVLRRGCCEEGAAKRVLRRGCCEEGAGLMDPQFLLRNFRSLDVFTRTFDV
jgi:hypothetical protein